MRPGVRVFLVLALLVSTAIGLGGTISNTPRVEAGQISTPATGDAGGQRPIADPSVDAAGTLADAIAISQTNAPAAGPYSADLDLPRWSQPRLSTNAGLQDFVAQLTYTAPPRDPAGTWKIGVCFWTDPAGNCYDLFIASDGSGRYFGMGVFNGDGYRIITSLDLSNEGIDLRAGIENTLTVVVYHGIGIISGSTSEVEGTERLPVSAVSGVVEAETGFIAYDLNAESSLPMSISSFAVWDLSSGTVPENAGTTPQTLPAATSFPEAPVAPTTVPASTVAATVAGAASSPSALDLVFEHERAIALANAPISTMGPGLLPQSTSSVPTLQTSNIAVTNLYVTATFVNPTDVSAPFDVGIGFRDALFGREYRFIVESDTLWWTSIAGHGSIVSDYTDAFDASPGATNTIELIAIGASGMVAINGQFVASLDLSQTIENGAVEVGSGFYSGNAVMGRTTQFLDCRVYALPQ